MKAISQFVVHTCDLIEAEGRSLLTVVRGEARSVQTAVKTLAMATAFLVIAVPLLVAGIGLLAMSVLWWLETKMDPPAAMALTGLLVLVVGMACLATFRLMTRSQHS